MASVPELLIPCNLRPCRLPCASFPDILEQLFICHRACPSTLLHSVFSLSFLAEQPLICPNLFVSHSASRTSMETSTRLPKAASGMEIMSMLAWHEHGPLCFPHPWGKSCWMLTDEEECGVVFPFSQFCDSSQRRVRFKVDSKLIWP